MAKLTFAIEIALFGSLWGINEVLTGEALSHTNVSLGLFLYSPLQEERFLSLPNQNGPIPSSFYLSACYGLQSR